MINMHAEELILLKKAAKLFPKQPNGKLVHLSTLYRYADGVEVVSRRGRSVATAGQSTVVKLETLLIFDARYTSKEAAQRFVEAYTAARDGERATSSVRATRDRQRGVSEAKQRLAKAGI